MVVLKEWISTDLKMMRLPDTDLYSRKRQMSVGGKEQGGRESREGKNEKDKVLLIKGEGSSEESRVAR